LRLWRRQCARRRKPALVRAAELVRRGETGRLLAASGTLWVKAAADAGWDPPVLPGLELFSYVVSTFGRPRRLYAEGHAGRLVSVIARLADEGLLSVEFGRVLPDGLPLRAEVVFEVVGETGAFRADGGRGMVAFFGGGVEQHPPLSNPKSAILEHFLHLVFEKDPARRLRPLEELLTAYRVAEAVRRALKDRQATEVTW